VLLALLSVPRCVAFVLLIDLTAHRGGRSDVHAIPQIALLRAYLGLLKYDLSEVCFIFISLLIFVAKRHYFRNPVLAPFSRLYGEKSHTPISSVPEVRDI